MNLIQLKHALRALSLNQLRKLDERLHELIRSIEEAGRAEQPSSPKQTVAVRTLGNRTYRLESIHCGKEKCKYARGKLYGPYWYSYARVTDKVISQYIGKKLPKVVERKLKYPAKKQA